MGLAVPALSRLGAGDCRRGWSARLRCQRRDVAGAARRGLAIRSLKAAGDYACVPSSSEAGFAKTAQEVFVAAPGVDVFRCRAAGGRRLAQALDQSGQHFGGAVFGRRGSVIGHEDPLRWMLWRALCDAPQGADVTVVTDVGSRDVAADLWKVRQSGERTVSVQPFHLEPRP